MDPKEYRIKFVITENEEEILVGSTYLLPTSIESAEMEFYKVMKNFDRYLKEQTHEKESQREEAEALLADAQ